MSECPCCGAIFKQDLKDALCLRCLRGTRDAEVVKGVPNVPDGYVKDRTNPNQFYHPDYFYLDHNMLRFRRDAPAGIVPEPIGYTKYRDLFYGIYKGKARGNCVNTEWDISHWDVSAITDMYSMFEGCTGVYFGDLSNWDVSNVKRMVSMFDGANFTKAIDLSKWDVHNVKWMSGIFMDCDSDVGDLRNWNLQSVQDMDPDDYACSFGRSAEDNYDLEKSTPVTASDVSIYPEKHRKLLEELFGFLPDAKILTEYKALCSHLFENGVDSTLEMFGSRHIETVGEYYKN